MQIISGASEGNQKLVNMVIEEMETVGIEFLQYDSILSGGDKVALVVAPGIEDYHWYRSNGDGTWSHKPGDTPVTNRETWVENGKLQYGDIITDPRSDAIKAGYGVFVGEYYIRPKGGKR